MKNAVSRKSFQITVFVLFGFLATVAFSGLLRFVPSFLASLIVVRIFRDGFYRGHGLFSLKRCSLSFLANLSFSCSTIIPFSIITSMILENRTL